MANKFQHLSFDVWNTLIVANPDYSAARTKYLAHRFDVNPNFAACVYTHMKRLADKAAEDFGHQFSTAHMYEVLVKAFDQKAGPEVAIEVRHTLEYLFKEHPPIYDLALVQALADRTKGSISILSNTNFITGSLLCETVFDKWQEAGVSFCFKLFSDEYGVAKPSTQFFGLMKTQVMELYNSNHFNMVTHVGDNERCDIYGAEQAGVKSQFVRNPADTLKFMKAYNDA